MQDPLPAALWNTIFKEAKDLLQDPLPAALWNTIFNEAKDLLQDPLPAALDLQRGKGIFSKIHYL